MPVRHSGPAPRLLLAALPILAATACDGGFGRAVTVSDSAGVVIVHSHRAEWSENGSWTINPVASYAIEGPAPGRPFGRIAGVALLEGGGVVVADAADLAVHFFDGTGSLIRSVQPGDAPVMPRSISGVHVSDGQVHVAQRGLGPTLVFDQEGRYLSSTIEPPPIDRFPFIAQYRRMADGSLLALQPPTGLIPRGEEWTEHASFIRIGADGPAERVIDLPAIRFARVPSSAEPVMFGPVLGFAFARDGVYAGYPDRWEITEYGPDGAPRRRIRRDWEPEPVPPGEADSVRNRLKSLMSGAGIPDDPDLREQPETQIRELRVATTLPAFGRLILDRAGRLWVERVPPMPIVITGPFPTRSEPTPWDVFDSDGRWLGTVATPADTHVTDIGTDALAGIHRAGGPDRVVIHRIDRDNR